MSTTSDRGQLLLVTALTLAVMLVTVALLLNTAIFTENIATRDTTADGTEAIELRGEAVAGVGELIDTENRQGGGDTAAVEAGIEAMEPLVERERGRHGTIANLSYRETTAGQLLRWADPATPRSFETADPDWTLVDSLTNSRAFIVELTTVPPLTDPTSSEIENQAFGVRFINDSAENVTLYLYEDDGQVIVEQATESTDTQPRCSITHDDLHTTVDFTGDRLSTTNSAVDCYRGLWPEAEPDEIAFINGDAAEGTFALTVDDSASPTSESAVQNDDAVYSATVDIAYRSPELAFETRVVVAPGEPR